MNPKKLSELANMVAVRNHAALLTQSRNLTTNEEYKALDELRRRMDKKFIEEASKLVVDAEPTMAQAIVKPDGSGRQPAVTVVGGEVVIEGDVPKPEPKQLELPIGDVKEAKPKRKTRKKSDASLDETQKQINKRVAEEKAKVQSNSFRRTE